MKNIFLLFCFALILLVSAVPYPERCNEIHASAEYIDTTDDTTVLSIDMDLLLYMDDNVTHVSVQNYTVFAKNEMFYTYPLSAYIDGNAIYCLASNNNETETCYFETQNSTFQLQASTNLAGFNLSSILFFGVVDEISFSSALGPLFTRSDNCGSEQASAQNGKYNVNLETCCTSFKATYIANGNPAPCSQFQSRSTLYNIDDNYSIFATAKFNYTLSSDTVVAQGIVTAPENTNILLTLNDFWACSGYPNASMTCNFPIFEGDNKFLFPLILTRQNVTNQADFNYESNAGRIIVRNNQTLFEEGFNFTPKNDCFFFTETLDATKVFTSQFCCTQFAN